VTFDVETDALNPREVTTIHCCAIHSKTQTQLHKDPKKWLEILENAEVLVGHNIIQYDIPAIQQVYPSFKPKGKVIDTLILCRMLYPNILDLDFEKKRPDMPIQMYGRHSLEAYGYRLGYSKQHTDLTDFSKLTPELAERCISDVELNVKLWHRLQPKAESIPCAVDLEMRFASLIALQERSGFAFDVQGALELEAEINGQLNTLNERLRQRFPFVDGGLFTPRRKDSSRGYVEGATMCRLKELNPNSRDHIAWVLQNHLGWKPDELTETGKPKIDETVLSKIPGAEDFVEILTLQKRLGQLSTGNNAWLKLVDRDNRIHGSVITVGCATARCAHVSPNMAQVPAVRSVLGPECRALFGPGSLGGGRSTKQVGVDLSGIEARCLAHYLWPLDDGTFANEVLNGDIHTANQKAAGLETRDQAKTFFYALMYGAGAEKLGTITNQDGKKLKRKYFKNMPALAELTKRVTDKAETQGFVKALDGRKILIRSPHSSLNFLLQSAGALTSKVWYNVCYDELIKAGLIYGRDWTFLAHVHDEIQFAVLEQHAERVGKIAVRSAALAGEALGFRIGIDAEYKIGDNWAECH
jgi:DNA polymerase I-like protein with 3'-5' exonuclease and polymerase domains